jgi:hypothetical protein
MNGGKFYCLVFCSRLMRRQKKGEGSEQKSTAECQTKPHGQTNKLTRNSLPFTLFE